ncbi:hypothetical protein [Mesorhizobium sp. B1-1-8]|uniref:hypothetical protein n=1 Tax=Mesorhizobium sp. B1-1-8 TaxID=2589976 RepID=UPI00112E1E8B|nr:hypothetical protein [Mesorhizobium sp. B1-1-8]UCI06102.1 hypothetical protein FJ974_20045 [Mesorhizobium sp. B1-1-8]
MKKYIIAALTIGVAIGPASALEAGLGGKVGGLGIGAGVSAGSQGVSVGAGTSVDGVGGANVGASVGAGNTGVSAGSTVGSTSGSVSTGIGVGDDPSAEDGSATAPDSPAAVTTAPAHGKTARQSITLPSVLRPSRAGDLTMGYPFGSLGALKAKPGTPVAVVRACRAAIMAAATPLGAISVHAVSAGSLRPRRGGLTAPITVRVDYARKGGIEVRQAQVGCRLDAAGRVTAII